MHKTFANNSKIYKKNFLCKFDAAKTEHFFVRFLISNCSTINVLP